MALNIEPTMTKTTEHAAGDVAGRRSEALLAGNSSAASLKRCSGWRHQGHEGRAPHDLPATTAHFSLSRAQADGLNARCKDCCRSYQRYCDDTWNSHIATRKAEENPKQVAVSVRFVVYGTPAPQGSKAFKGTFRGRDGRVHAKLVESSKKVKPWRMDVKAAAEVARNGAVPLDGPLVARMIFTLPKPQSAPKTRRTFADKKPDLSKLIRSTEDALSDAGLIADDARIVEYLRAAKVFPGEDPESLEAPGVWIEIRRQEVTM